MPFVIMAKSEGMPNRVLALTGNGTEPWWSIGLSRHVEFFENKTRAQGYLDFIHRQMDLHEGVDSKTGKPIPEDQRIDLPYLIFLLLGLTRGGPDGEGQKLQGEADLFVCEVNFEPLVTLHVKGVYPEK